MALTGVELQRVVDRMIGASVHRIELIEEESVKVTNSQLVTSFTIKDIPTEKKKHLRIIVEGVKFIASELNVDLTQIATPTRTELETRNFI